MAIDPANLFPESLTLPPVGQPLDAVPLPGGGGVYAFLDADNRVVQTIAAQSLRRSIRLRLEPPPDASKKRADLRAITRTVRWKPTASAFETSLVYLTLVRQLNPTGYRKQLGFGPAWFACVNLADSFPRWLADSRPAAPPAFSAGPFFERRTARGLVELLEDLFDLCRKHEILIQAPHGTPCAYHEMGQCPAPCNGSISLDAYRDRLAAAMRFAAGETDAALADLDRRMRQAAAAQAFEQAGRFKTLLERAGKILQGAGRATSTPDDFRYLIVQRGLGRAMLQPWFVRAGQIADGRPCTFRELPATLPEWINKCHNMSLGISYPDPRTAGENMALVCHYLARGENTSGCFIPAKTLAADAGISSLSESILAQFRRTPSRSENISQEDTGNA